ncbi:MAG: DEAD/DEAH box helicase [Bacteroidetes bacterium]|nr:DEAD/DEAH box helicase [Bacteroidota bacterium]
MKLYSYQQRALDAIQKSIKGSVYIPTGGGKTVIMLEHARQRILNALEPMTFVVVAPRILLANQLCSEFEDYLKDQNVSYMHVHSGETHHQSSTRSEDIEEYNDTAMGSGKHHFIFTTYNSIQRVNKANIKIDVVYFDEAHHCVKKSNFVGIAHTSEVADNAYFFTATPRINNSQESMNNTEVYGEKIISIPAKELIEAGSIIPPQVIAYESQNIRTKENAPFVDAENIIGILSEVEENIIPKVLVVSPSTRVIWNMFTESDLLQQLKDMGFVVMHITSKHGAYIDKQKVTREVFFKKMNEFGNDPNQKMIVFHYSILSEGMNVHGLTHCIMLRNLPMIEMAQTIGRVIRMHKNDRKAIQEGLIPAGAYQMYQKSHGKIVVPVSNNYGDKIARQLQTVVDAIFVKGELVCQ